MQPQFRLLPEWAKQEGVLISWPHPDSDWCSILPQIESCYIEYAKALSEVAKLIIVCPNRKHVESLLNDYISKEKFQVFEMPTNDTWTRDSGPLTVASSGDFRLLDYKFNGWGLKFPACFDNLITRNLWEKDLFPETMQYVNRLGFVLEGGSIEIDEDGTLLTTSRCLLSPNRNGDLSEKEIEDILISDFGASKVLWLRNGGLIGDDTDSHVDTLARFLPGNIIAYTACNDPADPQYDELKAMENELKCFTNSSEKPYRLLPLFIPPAMHDDEGNRIPTPYANFLLLNGTLFLPFYGKEEYDSRALSALQEILPDWKIIPLPCKYLAYQHGSFHCATMQLPRINA